MGQKQRRHDYEYISTKSKDKVRRLMGDLQADLD